MTKPQDSKYYVPPADRFYEDRWRWLRCVVLMAGGAIPLWVIVLLIGYLGSAIIGLATPGSGGSNREIVMVPAMLPSLYIAYVNLKALRFNFAALRAPTWDNIADANRWFERFWKALALALVAGCIIGCCSLMILFAADPPTLYG